MVCIVSLGLLVPTFTSFPKEVINLFSEAIHVSSGVLLGFPAVPSVSSEALLCILGSPCLSLPAAPTFWQVLSKFLKSYLFELNLFFELSDCNVLSVKILFD